MKKILAILTLASIVATATAQNIVAPGLYNKRGELVKASNESVMLNVTLHVVTEKFTPGVYARFAQKYLGQRAMLSENTSAKLVGGRLVAGAAEKPAIVVKNEPVAPVLPVNKLSAAVQSIEEQAAATANMIFSLRKSRLDLITGEAGENVFGAGLKNALEEIDAMEKSCLEMFFGTKLVTEEVHTFNIAVTPDKTQYVVCRFSDKTGVVAADDLSGQPVMLKLEVAPCEPNNDPKLVKIISECVVVPQVKCELLGLTTLLDTLEFASLIYAKSAAAQPVK